jgi:hypothetical protein
MGGIREARRLMGSANEGKLILMVGPASSLMRQMATLTGIPVRDAGAVKDPKNLARSVRRNGTSLALLSVAHEIEGPLNRYSFGKRLQGVVQVADKVIYCGIQGGVLVHPTPPGVYMEVRRGVIRIRRQMPVMRPGATTVGPAVDTL